MQRWSIRRLPASAEVKGSRPISTGAALALLGALVLASSIQPAAEAQEAAAQERLGAGMVDGLLVRGGSAHRILHFTFDDGPDPRTTPRLLDVLDAAGVKATFFFSLSRFRSKERRNAGVEEVAREVLERGHWVGSHSLDHVRMSRLGAVELRQQLDEGEQQFERVLGAKPRLFRPPFGARSRLLDRMLAERGYTTVLWNIGVADWHARPPEEFVKTWWRVLERREREAGERGGVVLLHDTHPWTVEAFQHIHAAIEQRNCELLAEGEELFDIVEDPAWFFAPRGEAPPGTEAAAPDLEVPRWADRQSRLRETTRQRCATTDASISMAATDTPGAAKGSPNEKVP